MLQLAVCDDEAVCLRQTVDILRAALGDTPHQLKTFQNAPAVLHMLAEDGYRPDIAVLDICMGELDGISLAKEINRLAPACRVIFLSSYAGYLMDAYEAEHIYYVLKSDEAARLPVALRKALGALSTEKTLTLRRGGSYQRVGLDTVLYLERSLRAAGCTGGRGRWRITVSGRTFCSTPASWRRGACFCGACSTGRAFRGGARRCSRS